jgi:hypothetical protein
VENYCPRCGTGRLGSFRYCRQCQYDFDSAVGSGQTEAPDPVVDTPLTRSGATPGVVATTHVDNVVVGPVAGASVGRRRWVSRRNVLIVGALVIGLAAIGNAGKGRETSATGAATNQPSDAAIVDPTRPATPTATPSVAVATDPELAPEITPQPTLEITPEPTDEPTTAPVFREIDEGQWEVGSEVRAGTYRTREPAAFCYWARLKGFGGTLDEIIANDNVVGYGIVTISKSDVGFESGGCPTWSSDLSRVTDSTTSFDDGTYLIGVDIKAGTYRNDVGDHCYWARLKGFNGTLSQIIANDNVFGGRATVAIRSSDKGFLASGCGTWTRR